MDSAPGAARGVVAPVRADPRGLTGPTPRAVAGRGWRRSSRGLYVPSYVEQTPAQRVVEVGVLVPRLAAVTGWGALAWHGGRWFSGLGPDGTSALPVPVATARRRIRPQPPFVLCEERLSPLECEHVDGIWVTTALRAVCFAMRYAPHVDAAVEVLDMACFDDLVSLKEVAAWIAGHPSYTGIQQARDAHPLGDENAWSPREVAMRLGWPAAYPTPLTNRPVFDLDGHHLGTPDLLDPRWGVAAEYDGALHLTSSRRARDLAREERLRRHGLEPVTMVAPDVRDPRAFRERLRSAYQRATRRSAADRRWTLALPPWWVPTFTVEQRRALTGRDREVWLRRGAG